MWRKMTFVVLCAFAGMVTTAVSTSAQEVYVVAADGGGNSNYILCNLDGTFGSQQYIGQIPQPVWTYGMGMGDFDNDGDYDFVIGTGVENMSAKEIYLYEKTGSGNSFAPPVLVGTWTEGTYHLDVAVADY
ncbi:MAG: hypothetical protein JSU69_01075, partial [Candidatus Zixiibacteriota bacterium]